MNRHPGIAKQNGKRTEGWQVRYRDASGRQRARMFRNFEDARDFKAHADIERRAGGGPISNKTSTTFGELAEWWVNNSTHRPTTAARRDGILRNHLLPSLGNLKVSAISASKVQELVTGWDRSGLSPHSIRNHLQIARQILQVAVNDGRLQRNPCDAVRRPKPRLAPARALTADECAALFAAVDPAYRAFLEVLVGSGCRWSELANLNIADFDGARREITVRDSKTAAGCRTIRLGNSDTTLIKEHLLAAGRRGSQPDSPLFVSPHGERLNYSNFRSRVFLPARKRAGLEDVTLHDLRRTHATLLISAGHNSKAVQQRMGHKSITTTLSYYTAVTEEDMADAALEKDRFMARRGSSNDDTSGSLTAGA